MKLYDLGFFPRSCLAMAVTADGFSVPLFLQLKFEGLLQASARADF